MLEWRTKTNQMANALESFLRTMVLTSRCVMRRNEELQRQYADASVPVPKPPHWGGYLLRPTCIEFWQGRPSRLHDRVRCSRDGEDAPWVLDRLQS